MSSQAFTAFLERLLCTTPVKVFSRLKHRPLGLAASNSQQVSPLLVKRLSFDGFFLYVLNEFFQTVKKFYFFFSVATGLP
jgi:hypothetical protein